MPQKMRSLPKRAMMFEQQNVWKATRLGKFTASEIYKLLKTGRSKDQLFGEVAMTYIHEKIAELLTGEAKDDISGMRALEWGAANEYDAFLAYQQHCGEELQYFGVADPRFFPYNAFSGGSPDGLGPDCVLEIKCPYVSSNHVPYLLASRQDADGEWLAWHKPEYYAQLQFNMLCTGKPRGVLISYDPRAIEPANRLAVIHVAAHEQLQATIKMRLEKAGEIVADALGVLDRPATITASPIPEGIIVERA